MKSLKKANNLVLATEKIIVKSRRHFAQGDLIRWLLNGIKNGALASSHPLRAARFLFLRRRIALIGGEWKPRWIDHWLWACEQTWAIPDLSIQNSGGNLRRIEIKATSLYWPESLEYEGLAWIYNEVFLPRWRNPYAYEIRECRIRPGNTVFDVGSCEGFFALYAATGRGARVIAFEPALEFLPSLDATIKDNGLGDRVEVLGIGLSWTDQDAWFDVSEGPFQGKLQKKEDSRPVTLRSLDSLLKEGRIPGPDFIKMDVEGHEESVIRGASRLIKQFQPRFAIAVYHTLTQAYEVGNAILEIDPTYNIHLRGMWLRDLDSPPRPATLFAWPGMKTG